MSFTETEVNILTTIRKITGSFANECSGNIDLRGETYQIFYFGTPTSVANSGTQYAFHTHPHCDGWLFGGPPSLEDYETAFFGQQISYIVGRFYIYRFDAGEHIDNYDEMMKKLKEEYEKYCRWGTMLEEGMIDSYSFTYVLERDFGLKLDVLEPES